MRRSMQVWSGFLAGMLLVGLPGVVTGLDGVAVAQTVEDQKATAQQLLNAGAEHLTAGNYRAALEQLYQAYTIYSAINDSTGLVQSGLLLAYAFAGLGDTGRARGIFQSFLNIAIENDLQWLEDQARQGLQVVNQMQNQGGASR